MTRPNERGDQPEGLFAAGLGPVFGKHHRGESDDELHMIHDQPTVKRHCGIEPGNGPSPLLSLPREVLLDVADSLSQRSLCYLARTCCYLHTSLQRQLFVKRNKHGHFPSLFLALTGRARTNGYGYPDSLRRALDFSLLPDPNAVIWKRTTALIAATCCGNAYGVLCPLKEGADVNATGQTSFTPLAYALERLSGKRGYLCSTDPGTPESYVETMMHLLKAGANPNCVLPESLAEPASHRGNTSAVTVVLKLLERQFGPINYAAGTALMCSMVSNGAKIHVEDELDSSLLHWAVKENDRSVVDFLLLHGADIDHGLDEYGNYETVLGLAVRACNVSMVEHLISKGATVNSEDQDKSTSGDVTLVELAVLEADNATLTALLRGGANPNILSGCTSSVLGEVMEKEDAYSMVLALLAANADVNLVLKEDGMAPLSSAMFYEDVDSRVEIVHELLKHGADPNARDSDDYTALTSALASKWTDDFLCLRRTAIVRALVKHGANVNHISQGWEDVGKSRRPLLLALSRYNGLVYGDASHDYDRVRKLYDQKVRQLNLNGPPDVAITLTDVPEEGWNNPIVPILLNAGAELWPHMFIKAPEGLCDDDTSD